METKYKITIPKPCHEDWNTMTPDETGRFCSSCVKSVVDFTKMNAPEIQEYFSKNQGQKICGRFKTEQVKETFDIQIPQSLLNQKIPFHKAFLLTLFVVMGSTLFSCKNHDDATLGAIVIVKDTSKTKSVSTPQATGKEEPMIVGKIDSRKYDSLVKAGVKMPPPPPVKQVPFLKSSKSVKPIEKQLKKPEEIITGDVAVSPHNRHEGPPLKKEFYTAYEVERIPTYPGGLKKFYEYFTSNFKIPKTYKDSAGRLFFSFMINTDGSLSDIRLRKGINETLDKEALRVMKSSPNWIPGENNGEKVKTYYTLPIKITAN